MTRWRFSAPRTLGLVLMAWALLLVVPAVALAGPTGGPDAFEPDNRIADAKRIGVDGTEQFRTISWDDPDYIRIPVKAGKAYRVDVDCGDYYVWGSLTAFEDADTILAENWFSGSRASLSFLAEAKGWVYLRNDLHFGAASYRISVVEREPASIAGVVSDDETGDPIEDVVVMLLRRYEAPYWGETWWDWTGEQQTGADGTYEFSPIGPDTYSLAFDTWYAPDYLTEFWDNRTNWEDLDSIVLDEGEAFVADAQLSRGGTLVGQITDEVSGEPLAGVWVEAVAIDSMSGYEGMSGYDSMSGYHWVGGDYTAPDGSYTVSSLRPGAKLAVGFWDDSGTYDAEWYDDAGSLEDATPITLAAGETLVVDEQLRIDPAFGGIRGRVTDEIDGAPLAEIRVDALMSGYDMSGYDMSGYDMSGYEPSTFGMSGYTYLDGTYRIGRFWAGTKVALHFSDPYGGYLSGYYDDPATPEEFDYVEVIGGQAVRADAAMARNPERAFLEGTVLDAETGKPFKNASVMVETMPGYDMSGYGMSGYGDMSGYWFWTRTGPDGHYRVRGLFPGVQYIAAGNAWTDEHAAQYYDHRASYQNADPLVFAPGEIQTADFDLHRMSELDGVVTDEGTGEPVRNVAVWILERTRDGMSTYTTQVEFTDRAGHYEFDRLSPDGDYVVRFDTQATRGYVSEYHDDADTEVSASTVKLLAGDNTIDASLAIAADTGSVGGVVLDEYGRVAEDVVVEVYSMDLMSSYELLATGFTDSAGAWSVPRLPSDGQYLVGFSDPFGRYVDEFFDDAADVSGATIVPVVAGETTSASAVLALLAPDSVPPEVFDDAKPTYDDEASFSIWATDDDSGVSKLFYRLDGETEVEVLGAGSETISTSETGDHTLVYWAKDRAGNISVPAIVDFTVGDT
ncbi:MAG: hypothetical protein U1E22_03185, partial [Coriobacteriia bacterium]|nr:hypothetical protein [Coriobacteriia bacterium]